MEVLVAWRAKQLLRKVTKNSCCSGEETEDESYLTYTLYDINKAILTNLEECVWISVLPLINKSEFAIHGIACDELSGFDLDFSINLRRALGVDSPHSHQAAEVRAIMFVCLTLSLCSQLAARPAAHVACTVDRAVLLRLCRQKHKKNESTYSIPVHQIGEPLWGPEIDAFQFIFFTSQYTSYSTGKACIPFFLEVLAWNSFSSTLTEILLYFMRQKKERRAPEHSRVAPIGISVWTCTPAGYMKG